MQSHLCEAQQRNCFAKLRNRDPSKCLGFGGDFLDSYADRAIERPDDSHYIPDELDKKKIKKKKKRSHYIFLCFSIEVSNSTSLSLSFRGTDSSGGAIMTTSLSNWPKLAPSLLRYASAASSAFDNSFKVGVSFF